MLVSRPQLFPIAPLLTLSMRWHGPPSRRFLPCAVSGVIVRRFYPVSVSGDGIQGGYKMNGGRWLAICASALALVWFGRPARADGEYDVHKKIQWNVKDNTTGKAHYTLHALAHDTELVHKDVPAARQDGKWSQDLAQDKDHRTGHNNWYTKWSEFDLSKGAYGKSDVIQADNGKAHAKSEMSISVNQPDKDGISGSVLHVWGSATVAKEKGASAYAQAAGRADVIMKGKITSSELLDPSTKKWVALKLDGSEVKAQGWTGAVIEKDPLELDVYDPLADMTKIFDLFDTTSEVHGDASIEWGADYITISAASDASAAMSFSTLDSIVTNPLQGSATFSNGAFTTTGYLSGLSWVAGTSGNMLTETASVPADLLTFYLDLDKVGLSKDHDWDVSVVAGRQGVAEDSVPEASTWASLGFLLALGGTVMRRGRSCA